MSYELHHLCAAFPRLDDDDFQLLKADIKENGQMHPIFLLDGMILDGGNRYRALSELGITPIFQDYEGDNPIQFVLSSNVYRRHLTSSQCAVYVATNQDWTKAYSHGGDTGANQHGMRQVAQVPLATISDRAKAAGVSERTQQKADKLVKNAPPEVVKQVATGEKSLNQALDELEPKKPSESKKANGVIYLSDIIEDTKTMLALAEKEIADLKAENQLLKKTIESSDKDSQIVSLTIRLNTLQSSQNKLIKSCEFSKKIMKLIPKNEVDAAWSKVFPKKEVMPEWNDEDGVMPW